MADDGYKIPPKAIADLVDAPITPNVRLSPDKKHLFKKGFNRIAGNKRLQIQLAQGLGEEQIRKTWEKDLEKFQNIRKKYLIYP